MTEHGSTWLDALFDYDELVRLLKLYEASKEASTEEEGESNE